MIRAFRLWSTEPKPSLKKPHSWPARSLPCSPFRPLLLPLPSWTWHLPLQLHHASLFWLILNYFLVSPIFAENFCSRAPLCSSNILHVFQLILQRFAYMCGSMMGRALQWAEARFSSLPVDHKAYDEFVDERKMVFDHLDYDTNSSHRLENLKTGGRSVSDYSVEFWTLVADVKLTEETLKSIFFKGLDKHLKDELKSQDEPPDLRSLVPWLI